MTMRCRGPLAIALLAAAMPAAATPAEDLYRAYLDLQRGSYATARDEAQRYLDANGPQFTAAFIVAMAGCMMHPHRASNAVPFRQLGIDYVVSGPKRLDVNRAVAQCTSPPPPPPPPPQAGVSVQGLSVRPDLSLARPMDDVPPPRHPRPVAPAVTAAALPVALPPPAPVPHPPRPDACRDPYVWRYAYPGDHVCVAMQVQIDAADDNAHAAERRDPGGAYGPMTCVQGYVWRGARDGDAVCVVPQRRDQASADNAAAASRRLRP